MNTMIVCTTDDKPLHPDDQKALEEYMEFRIKRHKATEASNLTDDQANTEPKSELAP